MNLSKIAQEAKIVGSMYSPEILASFPDIAKEIFQNERDNDYDVSYANHPKYGKMILGYSNTGPHIIWADWVIPLEGPTDIWDGK